MASATFQVCGPYVLATLQGNIDHDTADFWAMFVDSNQTPNPDTDDFVSDIRANEVTGTNLSADGTDVTLTATLDTATNEVRVEISDISIATVTASDIKHVYIYNKTPATDGTRHIVGYGTFDTVLAPNAGSLDVTFPAPSYKFTY